MVRSRFIAELHQVFFQKGAKPGEELIVMIATPYIVGTPDPVIDAVFNGTIINTYTHI